MKKQEYYDSYFMYMMISIWIHEKEHEKYARTTPAEKICANKTENKRNPFTFVVRVIFTYFSRSIFRVLGTF